MFFSAAEVDQMKYLYEALKKTVNKWLEDKAPTMGAALAYYSIFSIAPLLIIAIAIAGLIFDPEAARGAIEKQIEGVVGAPVAKGVESMLENVHQDGHGVLATIVGAFAIFAAEAVQQPLLLARLVRLARFAQHLGVGGARKDGLRE